MEHLPAKVEREKSPLSGEAEVRTTHSGERRAGAAGSSRGYKTRWGMRELPESLQQHWPS